MTNSPPPSTNVTCDHGDLEEARDHQDDPIGDGAGKRPRKKRRDPRKATKSHLENAALHYLGRFASSAENLRQVLMRKVYRSAQHYGTDVEEGAATIDDIIVRYRRSGLLNDRAYADARAADFHRRGTPLKGIRFKLMRKGLSEDDIEHAVGLLLEENNDADRVAAIALAKRRRLGPFGRLDEKERADLRDKQLATLARAGFDYETSRSIIDAENSDELENF